MPSWLPAYSPAQQALLAPTKHPIQVPAARVLPDLERFGYANNRRLARLDDAVKFTQLVATALEESPRFYVLGDVKPELANTIAQYGPAAAVEADPWYVTRRDSLGLGRLVPAEGLSLGRADYDRGEAARKKGDLAAAATAYRDAVKKAPAVPAFHLVLGDVLAATKDDAGAKAAYLAALAIDPTLATAHAALAEVLSRAGDSVGARRSVIEALALHPSSARALAAADKLTSGAASGGSARIRPYAVFIEVDAAGAIHADSDGGNAAALYASCRAVMRYEPDVRAALFGYPVTTPYFLSVAEEVICYEASLGARAIELADGDARGEPAAPDPRSDALLGLARDEGLSGFAMVELLGRQRPERARMAPPAVHRAMVSYVDRFVLGTGGTPVDSAPPGQPTAGR